MAYICNDLLTPEVNKHHEEAITRYRSAQNRIEVQSAIRLRPCTIAVLAATALLSACGNLALVRESKSTQATPITANELPVERPTLTRLETHNGVSLLFPLTPTPKTLALPSNAISRVNDAHSIGTASDKRGTQSILHAPSALSITASPKDTDAATMVAHARDQHARDHSAEDVAERRALASNPSPESDSLLPTANVSAHSPSPSSSFSEAARSNVEDSVRTTLRHYTIGAYELDAAANSVVQQKAAQVGSQSVVITGYTDSLGTVELNRRLALARAVMVKQAFMQHGVKAEQISVFSCTDCFNDRKVDFYLTNKQDSIVVDPNVAVRASQALVAQSKAASGRSAGVNQTYVAKR
jgi:outer membrane protein OmpA-like peptidoglycan-associated protein